MTGLRRTVLWALALCLAISCMSGRATAGEDIAGYFESYYRQQVVGATYRGSLDFLQDSATAHRSPSEVLQPSTTRSVLIDSANGYLQIDDSAGTDQVLTMAVYRRADGGRLLVVDSSNCADACEFSVEFFAPGADRLKPVASDTVLPRIEPQQFVRPGHRMPERLKSIAPSIDYLPARHGTTLTAKPWYGYEVEEQMRDTERIAIRNVVLSWDRARARFVMLP